MRPPIFGRCHGIGFSGRRRSNPSRGGDQTAIPAIRRANFVRRLTSLTERRSRAPFGLACPLRQIAAQSKTAVARELIGARGGGDILNSSARAVEYRDLVNIPAPGLVTGHKRSQFGVHVL